MQVFDSVDLSSCYMHSFSRLFTSRQRCSWSTCKARFSGKPQEGSLSWLVCLTCQSTILLSPGQCGEGTRRSSFARLKGMCFCFCFCKGNAFVYSHVCIPLCWLCDCECAFLLMCEWADWPWHFFRYIHLDVFECVCVCVCLCPCVLIPPSIHTLSLS